MYQTPVTFYSVGCGLYWCLAPMNQDDAMLGRLNYVLDQPESDAPKTMSTSYGKYEKDLLLEYTTALCDLYVQFGARGVSVLFPSGNDGVGDGTCKAPNGMLSLSPSHLHLVCVAF